MHTPATTDCTRLTPCLLRAIEEHKYLRSCDCGYEVDFLDATRDFRERHEGAWHAAKLRSDNAQQVQEIRKHLWIESEKAGRDVGRTTAGTDWVARHAPAWRRQRESLRGNDLVEIELTLPSTGLSRGRLEALVETVSRFSCDVFVSQEGILRPHFCLELEPGGSALAFLIFRSSRLGDLGQLRLGAGERLRLVGYGRETARALAAIEDTTGAAAAAC
jgi:hypothetical protein